jgi:hypothetical protein
MAFGGRSQDGSSRELSEFDFERFQRPKTSNTGQVVGFGDFFNNREALRSIQFAR